jgi:hypothetical protein
MQAAIVASAAWLLLAFRVVVILMLFGAAALWWAIPRLRSRRFVYCVWVAAILVPLLPFDVSLRFGPGWPRFVPLVMGLPTEETVDRAQRQEIALGGCVVTGFEPKWILIW